MSEHSILAPSSAARRVACPGSRYLESLYPETEESPFAKEGEAAHWVASTMLEHVEFANFPELLPPEAPNGERITPEMIQGGKMYLTSILGDNIPKALHIEERVSIACLHPEAWGTPDAWLYESRHLHIWDYKFGFGHVDVYENWQLIAYAAGILDHLCINGIEDQKTLVTFFIVQPRSFHPDGHVRKWKTNAAHLRSYFNKLSNADHDSMKSQASCKPNPECKNCLARSACPALEISALDAIELSMSNTPWDLTPRGTGNELRYLQNAAKLLEARISGLEEQALSMLRRGNSVPHFKVDHTVGREVWEKPIEEVMQLGELYGKPICKPIDLITPKQAIALGFDAELIRQYSHTPRGALKLMPDDGSTTRKLFEGNK